MDVYPPRTNCDVWNLHLHRSESRLIPALASPFGMTAFQTTLITLSFSFPTTSGWAVHNDIPATGAKMTYVNDFDVGIQVSGSNPFYIFYLHHATKNFSRLTTDSSAKFVPARRPNFEAPFYTSHETLFTSLDLGIGLCYLPTKPSLLSVIQVT